MNSSMLPLLVLAALMIGVMMMTSRRQKRQMQELQKLQNSLSNGDTVYTTSGLRGTVVDDSYEQTIDLEIADGVVTTWMRAAVREKVVEDNAAPEPAEAEDTPADPTPEAPAKPATDGQPTDSQTTGTDADAAKRTS
ncbi:preprotein translocase subunit YajC [Pseudonocardia eucalypti]|nr:preprotein translocase subunit YajC [Pseudonocardia eucalypti]